ncbi:LysM peptidoglycan-binding domain-containing protein [bacterium]|nr:LysM peptidoglycan-binding domain-containing protein [bacterium]
MNKSSFAQKNNDTIYINNQFFVKHIVKYGESIDDISKLHNVSVNKILLTNETSTKLYKDQTLFIPLEKKSPKNFELKSNKKYKIGLLLPFYKNLNDTLIASFEDKEEASEIILGKSVMALEFMQGVDLALDSIKKLGIAIDMNIIDTRNDSAKVVDIIKSKVLDTMDLIIGPIYSRNMQLVSKKYGSDRDKIIISPLSKSSDFLKNHVSTVQINTPFKQQSKIISEFIKQKYDSQNIIICYDEQEKGLALFMERKLDKMKNNISTMNMIYTHIDSIRNQFLDTQIVILPSNNRAFVSRMLGTLGGIDSSFTVFGLSNIKNYDHLDIENMMHLDVHFPDPYYFNQLTKRDSLFLYNFEEMFLSSPSRFSKIGYNIMINFCVKELLFNLEKYRINSGQVNINAPIVRYNNYFLERATY